MKIGDLVITKKGNLCVILHIEPFGKYASGFCDVLWLKSGLVKTGLHRSHLKEAINESR
jgi:hypothetical protein